MSGIFTFVYRGQSICLVGEQYRYVAGERPDLPPNLPRDWPYILALAQQVYKRRRKEIHRKHTHGVIRVVK